MIKGMTWTNIKSVWNLSGLSDVPYSAKQNWSGTFFAVTYSKLALVLSRRLQLGQRLENINFAGSLLKF